MAADALSLPQLPFGSHGPKVLWFSALVLATASIAWWIHQQADRAVDHLQVEGEFRRVQPEAVRNAVNEQLALGFIALDLETVRNAVEQMPWVARARVERVWPADVRIRIREHVPIARWGDRQLLSEAAVVFTPESSEIDPALPQMRGVAGHEREVMETFEGLNHRLTGSPFELVSLVQDPRGEWTARTVSGLELRLGREPPQSKLDTLLGPVAQALGQRLHEVAGVDLRYSNGFSVAWRPLQAAASVKGVGHE